MITSELPAGRILEDFPVCTCGQRIRVRPYIYSYNEDGSPNFVARMRCPSWRWWNGLKDHYNKVAKYWPEARGWMPVSIFEEGDWFIRDSGFFEEQY